MAAPSPQDLQQGVPQGANIVARQPAPGGGEILLDANGGVYAIGGAKYQGSYWDDNYVSAKDRNDPNRRFSGLEMDPHSGGYTAISEGGERFAFNTPYKDAATANSLYRDPAFLAFLRGSDTTLETAAQDVARKQAAYQQALALAVPQIQDNGQQERRGIDNSFEVRGVYNSGQRAVRNQEQEIRQGNQIATAQASTADQIGELHSGLAGLVAQQQQQAAEHGYNTAQTQELGQRQEALRQKYPAQFGGSA